MENVNRNNVAIKPEFGSEIDEPSSPKSLADIPQHNLATASRDTTASPKESRRSKEATRRKQVRSALKQKVASRRQNTKQHEETQHTTTTSDVLSTFKSMQITLPPIANYIPSSSLKLAPLRLETPETPETTKRDPLTSTRKSTTVKKTTEPFENLIAKAILSTPDHRMTSPQITKWIRENYPHRCTGKKMLHNIGQRLAKKKGMFKTVGQIGHCYILTVLPEMKDRFV